MTVEFTTPEYIAMLLNDFCRLTDDQAAKKKWTLEGLRACYRLLVELNLTDKARSEIRTPTTNENLHTIKELLTNMGLSEEAKMAEELITRLELSS